MPGPGQMGNITPTIVVSRKEPWPPVIAGKEVWRSAILGDHERPWFWRCPFCKTWIRAAEPNELKKFAGSHIGTIHR